MLAERGFVDARLTHIASSAGVADGSFDTYVESKDATFHEVADRLCQEVFAADPAQTTPIIT